MILWSSPKDENLAERLQWSTNALLNAQQNGTPFRHLLLHGPPGTGERSVDLSSRILGGCDSGWQDWK